MESFSRSALLFSTALVQRLDSPALRIPSTYIGVRRVRPTDKTLESKKRKRKNEQRHVDNGDGDADADADADDDDDDHDDDDDDDGDDDGDNIDDVWVPTDDLMDEDGKKKEEGSSATKSNRADQNNGNNASTKQCTNPAAAITAQTNDANDRDRNNPRGKIVYRITNPDGTTRRMTTSEKKELKHRLRRAKHGARREERRAKHDERIKEAKEGKKARRKEKYLNKRRNGSNGNGNGKQQKKKNRDEERNENSEQPVERKGGGSGNEGNEKKGGGAGGHEQDKAKNENGKKDDNVPPPNPGYDKDDAESVASSKAMTTSAQSSAPDEFDEELAALRGSRHGIPPVMLTPAASCLVHHIMALPTDCSNSSSSSSSQQQQQQPNHHYDMRTIMDADLSAQWAKKLQQSMMRAEGLREKEDMRPMAYKLVPEVWKRLCPNTLWTTSKGVEDNGDDDLLQKVKKEDAAKNHGGEAKQVRSNQTRVQQHSRAMLRNPLTAYDKDAYAIFKHLHQNSQLHLACGALFGCDFLLYDGKREDRHSFAGIRVYSSGGSGGGNCVVGSSGDDPSQRKFPIPSAYDMTGFVRTMNTARKIALVATVVRDEDNNVSRVAMVDLALEKVLTAQAHVRKGNTVARKTEEEAASGLARR